MVSGGYLIYGCNGIVIVVTIVIIINIVIIIMIILTIVIAKHEKPICGF